MKSSAQRQAEWRQRRRDMDLSISPYTKKSSEKPFVGCDGEGGGLDNKGRQNFLLFRIGDDELYTGNPLTTKECLNHICNAPSEAILVGFSFGYDITMILRDLDSERRVRLLAPKERGEGKSPYTYYAGYGIDYLPRQYLRVCRLKRIGDRVITVAGSARTIYETFGFFQSSFLKTLKQFSVGLDYLEMIERNKDTRSSFDVMTDDIRHYNKIECVLLAELMEKMRQYCYDANIRPNTWSGAGKLAAALHNREKTLRRKDVEARLPMELLSMAGEAYYGGRFEITRTGRIKQPIYEYDIRSAYPAAMGNLPCLEHGEWKKVKGKVIEAHNGLYISSVHFDTTDTNIPGKLGGLPIRRKNGTIFWPLQGNGVYWSCEIESAKKLGFTIKHRGGWIYNKKCDCNSFAWVNDLYIYRRSIGSSGPGYPIKLGINSLTGKFAQRIGAAPYHNMIWAGLITAFTRAKLNETIFLNSDGIVMIATDGIYSNKKLDLDIGEDLGQWEENVLKDGMFIVQPGLYWGAKKPKTRGMPLKYFEQPGRTKEYEKAWAKWQEQDNSAHKEEYLEPPSVVASLTNFIGLKLAQARGKPDSAGKWDKVEKEISFAWQNKRYAHVHAEGHVITRAHPGDRKLVSYAHNDLVKEGISGLLDNLRMELEDQPDVIDLTIPWKD